MDPPEPPFAQWLTPPSHNGLLNTDILVVARFDSNEELNQCLLNHQRYYQSMAHYIRQCVAFRDSAQRAGQVSGDKDQWWDFIYQLETFFCIIESRMMYLVEEMVRRRQSSSVQQPSLSSSMSSSSFWC
jgi:hypothetical protein